MVPTTTFLETRASASTPIVAPPETCRTSIRRRQVIPLTPAASAQTVPTAVEILTRRWTKWAKAYEKKHPKYEDAFIRTFLEAQNRVVAEFTQNTILRLCPRARKCRARQLTRKGGKEGIRLFLNPTTVTWKQVDEALQQMDFAALIQAVTTDKQMKTQRDGLAQAWTTSEFDDCSSQLGPPSGWAGVEEAEL